MGCTYVRSVTTLVRAAILLAGTAYGLSRLAQASQDEFHDAMNRGDLKAVGDLIDRNPGLLKIPDDHGRLPIHIAAEHTSRRLAELLLSKGADLDSRTKYGLAPLHYAAIMDNKELIQFILSCQVNVDPKAHDGSTPFLLALENGRKEIAELLLQYDVDLRAINDRGTALHHAAQKGYTHIVRHLLASETEINGLRGNGITPLHDALISGHSEVAELLIETGADVHARTGPGWTYIGGINRAYNGWQTPLILAARAGLCETVRLLLSKGAYPNAQDFWGLTALHHAARLGNLEMGRLLLDRRIDVNIGFQKRPWDIGGHGALYGTPLHLATDAGHAGFVKLLLDHKADPNARDPIGKAPLHRLVDDSRGYHLAGLLILRDDIVSTSENDKLRQGDRMAIVRLLASHGCNLSPVDQAGHTPLFYALKNRAPEPLTNALRIHGSALSFIDAIVLNDVVRLRQILEGDPQSIQMKYPGKEETPLHVAARAGGKEVVEELIRRGSKVDSRDWAGWTPLHAAAKAGHLEAARLLLRSGADVNAKDHNGHTPLYDVRAGSKAVIELLRQYGGRTD